MVEREAVLCPSCGTRNRPDWEFCARCDESLEGAEPVADDTLPTQKSPTLSVELSPHDEGSALSGSSVLVVAVLAFGVLGIAAYRHISTNPPPEGPDPDLFTVATRPPEPAKAPPNTQPGAGDFAAGRHLLGSGDARGSISLLEAAVNANPDDAAFRGHLAYALWETGDVDGALSQYQMAAQLDENRQLQYARALVSAGRPDEAQVEYETILSRAGDGPSAVHEDYGRLLYRQGRYAEAAPHLGQAVRVRSDDPVLKQELAYALDQQGAHEEAETVYRDVLDTAPQAAITRGLLAENLYDRGRKDEAVSVLQEGLAMTPDAPLLQRQMGSLLEREGKRAEAAEAYRAYAELAPNAPDAATMVERASRLEGRGGAR